jgi:hypothetical protein
VEDNFKAVDAKLGECCKVDPRLYTISERKGWAEEAQAYNGLVVSCPDIRRQSEEFTFRATS